MKKFISIFNWCKNQEEKILSNLDKKKYIIEFLEQLAQDTTENEIDDIFVDFIKNRLKLYNETKIKNI